MIPCIFLRDKNILLCTMSGRTLKTKTIGAEILSSTFWFEHLGFFWFSVTFSFYFLTYRFWFGVDCMICWHCGYHYFSFSHRLVGKMSGCLHPSVLRNCTSCSSTLQRLFSTADVQSVWLEARPRHSLWLCFNSAVCVKVFQLKNKIYVKKKKSVCDASSLTHCDRLIVVT